MATDRTITKARNPAIDHDTPGRMVVIGASTGGFEALKTIVKSLPERFDGAIFIVWHMASTGYGVLAGVLNDLTSIHTAYAYDKETIHSNRIYLAPPDHHLLIEEGILRVTKGPKENRFRPAIDPLFRSAAYFYGARAVGVILSGGLDDGTAGLRVIKENGGIAIVQDPYDAEVGSMPLSALRAVDVDFVLPVSAIAAQLIQLSNEEVINDEDRIRDEKTKIEIGIAAGEDSFKKGSLTIGKLSPVACPECHGVLSAIKEGNIVRFRCHTGHAFSADALMSSLTLKIEEDLYSALRGMDETVLLLNYVGDHFADTNHATLAGLYFEKAKEAEKQIGVFRNTVHAYKPPELMDVKNLLGPVKGSGINFREAKEAIHGEKAPTGYK